MAKRSFGMLHGKNKRAVADVIVSSNQVLTTWDDMIAANMPKASVENAYKQKYGTKPDQVHLNDDFCKNYGWLSYNLLGELQYYNVKITPKSNVENERILSNDTDEAYQETLMLSTTASNSATMHVTSSSSISIGNNITVGSDALGIKDEFSQSFTFSNEVGSSSTQSTSVTITDTITVTVPPHSSIRVYLQVEWTQRNQDWDMPVNIDQYGRTGAQFPHPVGGNGGHYYWDALHCNFFAPPFQSKMRGTLLASYDTKGKAIIEYPTVSKM